MNSNLATYLTHYAKVLMKKQDYTSANFIYKLVSEQKKEDPNYIIDAIVSAYNVGDNERCESLYYDAIALLNKQLQSTVGMTDDEMQAYWATYNQLKDYLFLCRPNEKVDSELYTILLTHKNFLLNSSIHLNMILSETSDIVLQGLLEQRQEVSKEINQMKIEGINNDVLDSLKLRSINIERDIARSIKDYSILDVYGKYTYFDIAGSLKPEQAAIEFIDYSYREQHHYAAMIAMNGMSSPIFVSLCDENEILPFLSKSPKLLYDSNRPLSHDLYQVIWAPIEEHLANVNELFLSMSGILHTVAVEMLSDDQNVIISDKYRIHRVSSTRSVVDWDSSSLEEFDTPILFGDINYSASDYSESVENSGSDYSYLSTRALGKTITDLPGTRKEINQITKLFSKAKKRPIVYSRSAASEEAFKSLGELKPSLLHIATHGFYIPQNKLAHFSFYGENDDIDPLSQSGLLLAGASLAWSGNAPINKEDGVLTAKEICEVDLSDVSLLVLSACETGLGEINDNGVYGIQRAFKNAGVHSIVMSLWEVDDKSTDILMESFYSLLLSGMNKWEAFSKAQQQVRNQKAYQNPYYWGGFVLLD